MSLTICQHCKKPTFNPIKVKIDKIKYIFCQTCYNKMLESGLLHGKGE